MICTLCRHGVGLTVLENLAWRKISGMVRWLRHLPAARQDYAPWTLKARIWREVGLRFRKIPREWKNEVWEGKLDGIYSIWRLAFFTDSRSVLRMLTGPLETEMTESRGRCRYVAASSTERRRDWTRPAGISAGLEIIFRRWTRYKQNGRALVRNIRT